MDYVIVNGDCGLKLYGIDADLEQGLSAQKTQRFSEILELRAKILKTDTTPHIVNSCMDSFLRDHGISSRNFSSILSVEELDKVKKNDKVYNPFDFFAKDDTCLRGFIVNSEMAAVFRSDLINLHKQVILKALAVNNIQETHAISSTFQALKENEPLKSFFDASKKDKVGSLKDIAKANEWVLHKDFKVDTKANINNLVKAIVEKQAELDTLTPATKALDSEVAELKNIFKQVVLKGRSVSEIADETLDSWNFNVYGSSISFSKSSGSKGIKAEELYKILGALDGKESLNRSEIAELIDTLYGAVRVIKSDSLNMKVDTYIGKLGSYKAVSKGEIREKIRSLGFQVDASTSKSKK